jgi:uncharacterized protein (DUF1697 family)
MAKANSVHVALLRGINVGGKHKLPMKDLTALFQEAGCEEVRTYIQSGNVLFRAGARTVGELPQRIATAIHERFGFPVPVVIRSAGELVAVARANPYAVEGADPLSLHVGFLADRPGRAAIASLDPRRSPPDTFTVHDREIYLHCPKGIGKSKLTVDYFERVLGTATTVRNWRTVSKLVELLR